MPVTLHELVIPQPTRAIICFGPPTDMIGMKAGVFFEVIIDPNMVSPGGAFIRFEQSFQKGEVHGWQRVNGITICEILGAGAYDWTEPPAGYVAVEGATVTLRAVKSWEV